MDKDLEKLITKVGTKGNTRCITIADNIPEHWPEIISIAKSSYDFWAYIYHDSDADTEKHLHIVCLDKGGTSLKSHIARFSSVIPGNFVNKVFSPRAMCRYLIHKDQPDKFQYSPQKVFTNNIDKFSGYLLEENNDSLQQFHDFQKLLQGMITFDEYFDKYRSEFSTMTWYQKQSFFHKVLTSKANLTFSPPLVRTPNNNNNIKE